MLGFEARPQLVVQRDHVAPANSLRRVERGVGGAEETVGVVVGECERDADTGGHPAGDAVDRDRLGHACTELAGEGNGAFLVERGSDDELVATEPRHQASFGTRAERRSHIRVRRTSPAA